MKKNILFTGIIIALIFSACSKTEEFKTDPISDYAPLIVGKYITYQLDSQLYADNIIPEDRAITYQVKHLVEDTIIDNLGRKGFIIRRYIRKNATDNWMPDNAFMAINTGSSYEYIENNLRFIKLKEPIRNEYSWKGNSYIDTHSDNPDLKYFDDWNYVYDSINTPLTLGAITIDSTLKVAERDEIIGIVDPSAPIYEINFSASNYAKGIGLVYHRFVHLNYQNIPGVKPYKVGYGITLTMIDHN